ncbi:MAG: FAD/NAD(P)-binding protein [Candidatus Marinimicrobia bacterium]|nr:FAD/NAD(P)-binding protein [Candidatus Neomarinimicrobiota bacterium]
MNKNNPFEVVPADVTQVIQESPTIKTLRVLPQENFDFETGQFAEFSIPDVGEAPFTPSSSMYNTDYLDFTIMKTGFVTEKTHEVEKGATIGLRGPFGSSYPIHAWEGKDVLIMGGGVGMAPTRSLLLSLIDKIGKYNSVTYLAGARTPEDMIYKEEVKEWRSVSGVNVIRGVDEVPAGQEWNEEVGLITTLLEKIDLQPDGNPVVVCGPPIMMKFSTFELLDYGYSEENIFLSMEKKMYCGHGQCRHCMIGEYYSCKDGPVFTYDKIKDEENIWE